MRRRSFLAAIAAAFVAPDPERLLWQPGQNLISIPAAPKVVPLSWCDVVSMEPVVEDVTTLGSLLPWRQMEVFGYNIHFRDGSQTYVPNGAVIRDPNPIPALKALIQSPAPATRLRPR